MTIYIYALKDPFTDEIRYIGKTIRPRERLANQCNEKSNTHRCHWIQSIVQRGERPIQIILEEVPDNANWQDVERKWITHGKEQGWPLTNATSGGDGVPDLSGESKKRLMQTWKGRKHKPESLVKIGNASRGRIPGKETRQKMSEAHKGRKIEWGDKIGRAVSKLSDNDIHEIRQLLTDGVSQYKIADMYGVHQTTISNIKRGLFYSDVE